MNNTCPNCATAYNITPALIGKAVTCKKCGSSMIVDESGLRLRGGPQSGATSRSGAGGPPAPPEDDIDEDFDEAPPPPREYRRPRPRRRASSGNDFADVLTFRKLMAPFLAPALFYLGTVYGLYLVYEQIDLLSSFRSVPFSAYVRVLLAYVFGVLVLRLFAEYFVALARTSESNADIRALLERQDRRA